MIQRAQRKESAIVRRPTRKALTLGVVLALSGVMVTTGCQSQPGGASNTQTSAHSTLPASQRGPATFTQQVEWKAATAAGALPLVSHYGVFTLAPFTTSAGLVQTQLVRHDPDSGSVTWQTPKFNLPSRDTKVQTRLVRQGGKPWLVIWYQDGAKGTAVLAVDPNASKGAFVHSEVLTGSTTPPAVQTTDRGVLITGVDKQDPFLYWPQDGSRTTYTNAQLADSAPRWAYDNGWVVTVPHGFGYAVAATPAWTSQQVAPGNVDPQSGVPLAVVGGVILTRWKNHDGANVLAAQDVRTGAVRAQLTEVSAEPLAQLRGEPVVSGDGTWVAWGGYVLGLKGGPSHHFPVHGARVGAIYDDVVYLTGSDGRSHEALDASTGTVVDDKSTGTFAGVTDDGNAVVAFSGSGSRDTTYGLRAR